MESSVVQCSVAVLVGVVVVVVKCSAVQRSVM